MNKRMFSTRIDPAVLKELKHLSIDAEKPISELTEEAIRDLIQKYEMKDKKMSIEGLDKRFGTIALEKGFISRDNISEALKIQVTEDLEGMQHRLIGQILLEKNYITNIQINEVLKSMGI
jgi:K+ transporter